MRVLQEREVERVGGHKTIKLDIRVLATSNRDMPMMVKNAQFREDLYYRLNVFPIEIPSLRERPLDIEPLVLKMVGGNAQQNDQPLFRVTPEAMEKLVQYSWPGNIRELENVIQRAMILATDEIDIEHIHLPENKLYPLKDKKCSEESPQDMKSLERKHILETLASVNGSRKLAVKKLGISERTLRYKLQQYRLINQEN